jgi:hypothetical protein
MKGKVAGHHDDVDTLKTEVRAVNTQYFTARGFKDGNERHENIAASEGPCHSLVAARPDTKSMKQYGRIGASAKIQDSSERLRARLP